MSRPAISCTKLNQQLSIAECHPDSECPTINWCLYDTRAGYNIAMSVPTRDKAFVTAIEYWAKRALKAEQAHKQLKTQVDAFVEQFVESDDDDDDTFG
jgi:hypothetical protein